MYTLYFYEENDHLTAIKEQPLTTREEVHTWVDNLLNDNHTYIEIEAEPNVDTSISETEEPHEGFSPTLGVS